MTIIFAMVIFAVAGIISMVVVNSAQANAGRLAREKKTEQDYLAATSVAAFLRDITSGDSVTYTVELNETDQETLDTHTDEQDDDYIQFAYTDSGYTNEFYSAISALIKQKVGDGSAVVSSAVEMDGMEQVYEVTQSTLGKVRVTFSMAESYPDFTLSILVERLDESDNSTYGIKIVYPGQVETSDFLVERVEIQRQSVTRYNKETGTTETVEEDVEVIVPIMKRTYNISWVGNSERIYKTTS